MAEKVIVNEVSLPEDLDYDKFCAEIDSERAKHLEEYLEDILKNNEDPIRRLEKEGYEMIQKLPEGNTRAPWIVKKKSTGQSWVAKIPKTEVNEDSLCTLLNLQRGVDRDSTEANVATSLQHPYIAQTFEVIPLSDGRRINIESYQGGQDLEEVIKLSGGPLKEERTNQIFSQILEALIYMNIERGVLHRDIKPSNILLTSGGVKITDLQNAASIKDVQETCAPTRGGTQYTMPQLINSLANGSFACASERTEVYSLGATLYFMLTGKNAFNYHTPICEDGKKEIKVGNRNIKFDLKDGDEIIDSITKERHDRNLERALKEVPRKYHRILRKALSTDSLRGYRNVQEMKRDYDRINSGLLKRIGNSVMEGIKPGLKIGLPILAAGAVLGAIVVQGIKASKEEPKPTAFELMQNVDYRQFGLEDAEGLDKEILVDVLTPYFNRAEKRLKKISQEDKEFIDQMTGHGKSIHHMDPRLISSWLRACYIESNNLQRVYSNKNGRAERAGKCAVPQKFIDINQRRAGFNIQDESSCVASGTVYLKSCLGPNRNIADVFAEYFCSNEEINTARIRTESVSYFPKYGTGDSLRDQGLRCGYAQFIDNRITDIINTAIALYQVTDKDGNIDFSKKPVNYHPGKWASNLHVPERSAF